MSQRCQCQSVVGFVWHFERNLRAERLSIITDAYNCGGCCVHCCGVHGNLLVGPAERTSPNAVRTPIANCQQLIVALNVRFGLVQDKRARAVDIKRFLINAPKG